MGFRRNVKGKYFGVNEEFALNNVPQAYGFSLGVKKVELRH